MSADTSTVGGRVRSQSAGDAIVALTRLARNRPALVGALIGLLAAAPSLAWAARGPDLLTDDFSHLARWRTMGAFEAMKEWAFVNPARPLAAFYHLATYGLIGDRPIVQALVLAGLNAAVAVAIWRSGQRLFGHEVALLAGVLYAVFPNRAATRLWFATGNYLLSTLLVLLGWHLLVTRRYRSAAALMGGAVLLFEGVIGLAVAGVTLWTFRAVRSRALDAAITLTPAVAAVGVAYVLSPKRISGGGPAIGSGASTLGHGLLGAGLLGEGTLMLVGPGIVACACVYAVATCLPSFRRRTCSVLGLRLTLLAMALTTAPLVTAGLSFATQGIFDRANAIPLVSVAFFLSAVVRALHAWRSVLACGLLVAAVTYLLLLNTSDVDDYVHAARVGERIADRVEEDLADTHGLVLVGPAPGGRTGVAQFIYPQNLQTALRLRGSRIPATVLLPWSRQQCREMARRLWPVAGYDWTTRDVLDVPAELCSR